MTLKYKAVRMLLSLRFQDFSQTRHLTWLLSWDCIAMLLILTSWTNAGDFISKNSTDAMAVAAGISRYPV